MQRPVGIIPKSVSRKQSAERVEFNSRAPLQPAVCTELPKSNVSGKQTRPVGMIHSPEQPPFPDEAEPSKMVPDKRCNASFFSSERRKPSSLVSDGQPWWAAVGSCVFARRLARPIQGYISDCNKLLLVVGSRSVRSSPARGERWETCMNTRCAVVYSTALLVRLWWCSLRLSRLCLLALRLCLRKALVR